METPDPSVIFPVPTLRTVTYVKPTITSKHIIVGDFTYFSGVNFEQQVTHFYPDFYHDKLIIGKFCQIASGVEFIMNGAQHKMDCASTFPFYIFEKWGEAAPEREAMPCKGDTVVGNDVWIGQNAVILPGTRIGDGAIIGAYSVAGGLVEPYTVVAGNPARRIRRRFDGELTALLLRLRWWDLPAAEIQALIPLLHTSDTAALKAAVQARLPGAGTEGPRHSQEGGIC
ncbi:MAG: CatB-related O-acetyltransferase [Spirochaetaceae bacterium]|jgi:virginiamycin A acetyltransferase|nr:CatB-related O-acetyltransferase [Spirochaetaceae bacterium]